MLFVIRLAHLTSICTHQFFYNEDISVLMFYYNQIAPPEKNKNYTILHKNVPHNWGIQTVFLNFFDRVISYTHKLDSNIISGI